MPPAHVPTEAETRAHLRAIMKSEHHHLIPQWLKTATDAEKRGVASIANTVNPPLMAHIGRPTGDGNTPAVQTTNWYHSTKYPPAAQSRRVVGMGRSASSSGFVPHQPANEWSPPDWMREDHAIMENISKPGGYYLEMKDTIQIQMLKNTQRNKGTYNLFSGTFDGASTQQGCHTAEAAGHHNWQAPP